MRNLLIAGIGILLILFNTYVLKIKYESRLNYGIAFFGIGLMIFFTLKDKDEDK